MQKKTI